MTMRIRYKARQFNMVKVKTFFTIIIKHQIKEWR